MTSDSKPFRDALSAARQRFKVATVRLDEARREAAELEDEITKLRRTITALSAMCSERSGLDTLGITDAVDAVMATATTTMTSAEVKKALATEGFDLEGHKNGTASVHAVLTRLAAAGKIERTSKHIQHPTSGERLKVVAWKGPKYDDSDIPF